MQISEKSIVKYRVFQQSVEDLWQAWTTHSGLKTFFGVDNHVELKPNGAYEIYFMMDNPPGQRGSETCKVLSFIPKSMLSFTWNAPPQFEKMRKSDHKTWVVVEFKPYAEHSTGITLTHLGWLEGEEWNQVYDYFNSAWDEVLHALSKKDAPKPSTQKVMSLGGVFFKSKNPKELMHWYRDNLGINSDDYGMNFEWRFKDNPELQGSTLWSPFASETDYFLPSTKEFMLNFRVANIHALVEELRSKGIVIHHDIVHNDYGYFAHILDPDGTKIELWSPPV